MKNTFWFLTLIIFVFCVFMIARAVLSNSQKAHRQEFSGSETLRKQSNPEGTGLCYENYRNRTHSPFGYPIDSDTADDFLIVRAQYVLSYCGQKNVPNWVAWELNQKWLGDEDRYSGRFISDRALPDSFSRVTHDDYTNSGYDRGHIVRSKERTRDAEDNKSTFLLTNIIPQTPDLNRGVWLRFEDYYLNKLVKENKQMYIVSGGIFNSQNTLNNAGKVAIPDSCFKIVLITHHRDLNNDIRIVDFEAIAVSMPNVQGVRRTPWQEYITTVKAIENSTGYNFFSCLPDSIEDVIETKKYVY